MNNFLKIIKSLRKSTLEDIGKKIGNIEDDLDKEELIKRIESVISRKKLVDSIVFQIGYPVLLLMIGFFIGKMTDISNTELKNTQTINDSLTQKHISKLYKPLPSSLKIKNLKIQIDTSAFEKFLPEIRNRYFKAYGSKSKTYEKSGFQFHNDDVMSLFENKDLNIRISVGDSLFEEEEKSQKPYLFWKYKTKLSLKNRDQALLSYWIENTNYVREYIELDYINEGNDKYLKHNNISYLKDGADSAIDLCDKIVKIEIDINENGSSRIVSPQLLFKTFTLADNYGGDYEIKFLKHSYYYDIELLSAVRKHYPDYKISNLQWYIEGVLKCKSF